MHYPLADTGRKILLGVGTHGIEQSDGNYGSGGKFQGSKLILAGHPLDQRIQPTVDGPGPKDIVEDDLQWPRLEQIGRTFTGYSDQANQDGPSVGLEEIRYP